MDDKVKKLLYNDELSKEALAVQRANLLYACMTATRNLMMIWEKPYTVIEINIMKELYAAQAVAQGWTPNELEKAYKSLE